MRASIRDFLWWVIFAALAWALFGTLRVWAQQVLDPRPLAAVCAYSASPPTVSSGQFVYLQCNSSGQVLLH